MFTAVEFISTSTLIRDIPPATVFTRGTSISPVAWVTAGLTCVTERRTYFNWKKYFTYLARDIRERYFASDNGGW